MLGCRLAAQVRSMSPADRSRQRATPKGATPKRASRSSGAGRPGGGSKGRSGRGASVLSRGVGDSTRSARGGVADRRRSGRVSGTAPRPLGGEQVEGRQAVRELLAAGRRAVKEVWISEDAESARLLDEIADLALAHRVPLRRVGAARLRATARTEAPQGVLAIASELEEAELEQLLVPRAGVSPFLVVVDGVTDPHNLGALMRSAEAAGVSGIVLPRHRAVHVTATVAKAAAGAVEHLPMAVVPGVPAALASLAKAGVWTVGLDPRAEQSIYDFKLATEPVALVLGAEGKGLSRLALQRCDAVVRIPQRGSASSLNVSAAGAVACFEVARRRENGATRS